MGRWKTVTSLFLWRWFLLLVCLLHVLLFVTFAVESARALFEANNTIVEGRRRNPAGDLYTSTLSSQRTSTTTKRLRADHRKNMYVAFIPSTFPPPSGNSTPFFSLLQGNTPSPELPYIIVGTANKFLLHTALPVRPTQICISRSSGTVDGPACKV